jgi:hypothetical protein
LPAGPYPILKTYKVVERKEKEASSRLKNKKLLVIFFVANFRHIVKNVLEKTFYHKFPGFWPKTLSKNRNIYLKNCHKSPQLPTIMKATS